MTTSTAACENIAGITNKAGNVLGMMPHPERAMEELARFRRWEDSFLLPF